MKIINAAIFIILEVAALNMLNHNGAMQNAWFSRGAHAIMGTVWGGTEQIKDYFSLKKVNDALARENLELRIKLTKYETESAAEAEDAQDQDITGEYRYIPASIMKISNNTQHNYMIIGKGSEDGARLGKEGAVGPMSWDGISRNGAILKEIPHHVEFEPGDTVYTSGFSSIFPPDIPLGTTGKSKIVNGATYEIEITLFEDFGSLRHVTIVENLGKAEITGLEGTR